MPKATPRRTSSAAFEGTDRSVAALALLAGCILVALLLLFGLGGAQLGPSGGRLVKLGEAAPAPAQVTDSSSALIGSPTAQAATSGRRFATGLALKPSSRAGLTPGFVVGPDSDSQVLAATRLRPGDVLVEVDGSPLDGGRVQRLADELSTLDRVEFSFERDGQVRNRTIDLARS